MSLASRIEHQKLSFFPHTDHRRNACGTWIALIFVTDFFYFFLSLLTFDDIIIATF